MLEPNGVDMGNDMIVSANIGKHVVDLWNSGIQYNIFGGNGAGIH